MSYKHELTGAVGYPIRENPTGIMLEAAYKAMGLHWRYQLLEVPEAALAEAVDAIRVLGFVGMNFTIPHKVNVLKHIDEVSKEAEIIGAVNTVWRKGKKLIGENTDGKGFVRALEEANVSPAAHHAVILGAGGAARAISVELALAGTKVITIVNRSEERGMALVDRLNEKTKTRAEFVQWRSDYSVPEDTDILVNATSIGLYPEVTDKPDLVYDSIKKTMVVCDVIPNPPNTLFLQEAHTRGAKTLDGLGMLVYQGAIAVKLWSGQDPPTDVMKAELERLFS